MTSQGRAAFWFLSIFFLASSAIFSSSLARLRVEAGSALQGGASGEDLRWLISRNPEFSFGFRNFLADLCWLQAVQVAGARRMSRGDYDRLDRLIRTVNNFDPRFAVPFFLGGLVLGDSPDHVQQALAILGRGWENHPRDWRFPFYIGYLRYFSLGDPAGGGRILEAAARLPDAPPYLPLLASRMLSEGRQPDTALAFLSEMVKHEADPTRLEILNRRIREVVVEKDVQMLEKAVGEFREKTGAPPPDLSALVRAGFIGAVPEEPNGGRYLLSPDGSVRSSRMPHRLKVFRAR